MNDRDKLLEHASFVFPEDKQELQHLSVSELIDVTIEESNRLFEDYETLLAAYEFRIPLENFEHYREEVEKVLSGLKDGELIREGFLESMAKKYSCAFG